MTQLEIAKFLVTQTVITRNDIDENQCIKEESKQKIAEAFHIELEPGKTYSFKSVIDNIMQEEAKKKQEETSEPETKKEKTAVEQVVELLEHIASFNKSDNYQFVVKEINRLFPKINVADVIAGVNEATNRGFTSIPNEIIREYRYRRSLKVLNTNYEIASAQLNSQELTEEDFLNRFSNFLYQNYKMYGVMMTPPDIISQELQSKLVDRFYERLAIDIDKKYSAIKLRGNLLAKEILKDFEHLDKERIFAILETCNIPSLNIDRLYYQVYCLDDGKFLLDEFRRMSSNGATAQQVAQQIRDNEVGLEYPKEFVERTIKQAQEEGIKLPYDEIFKILGTQPEIKKSELEESELEIDNSVLSTIYAQFIVYSSEGKNTLGITSEILRHFSEEQFRAFLNSTQKSERPLFSDERYEEFYRILNIIRDNRRKLIRSVLLEGSKSKWITASIVRKLKSLPSACTSAEILLVISEMEKAGLVLPAASYEEIKKSFSPQEKETEEEINAQLPSEDFVLHKQPMATLNSDGDDFEEQDEHSLVPINEEILNEDYEPISTGKRHRVLSREKAKSASDKKAVIAAILVALGAASTAVLATAFGVNPLSAAKNTVTSIMSVASRNPALAHILPAIGDFVKSLAVFGLAATGTIAWLKRRKAKAKIQQEEDVRKLVEQLLQERDEMKEGGKTK